MNGSAIVILDLGKSFSKLTVLGRDGGVIAHRAHANRVRQMERYRALDEDGIADWLANTLSEFAATTPIGAIIPIGHGAAAAIVRNGVLACPPLDYEDPLPDHLRAGYDEQRDSYALTGSPTLPLGLNLGAQLHALEALDPDILSGSTILPWPQYWGWRLSGVASCEVTSLGCHSDLWRPCDRRPSALSEKRGWNARLAPVRHARDRLGILMPEFARRTGLGPDVAVHTGLHDSNAALLAARDTLQAGPGVEMTVLSTGTWFVAMRSPAHEDCVDLATLAEGRDVLVNVDVDARPIPSARAMLGREVELLGGSDSAAIDRPAAQQGMIAALPAILATGAMILPTAVPGVGPFPNGAGGWIARPQTEIERAATVALYAAMVSRETLALVGATGQVLVEGRFARCEIFVRALASLMPTVRIWVAASGSDIALAAGRLIDPGLLPPVSPRLAAPLDLSLEAYHASWTKRIEPA
jgi:sugar (pentulose or hexulose) kinase